MKFQDNISIPVHTYGQAVITMSPLFQSLGHKNRVTKVILSEVVREK